MAIRIEIQELLEMKNVMKKCNLYVPIILLMFCLLFSGCHANEKFLPLDDKTTPSPSSELDLEPTLETVPELANSPKLIRINEYEPSGLMYSWAEVEYDTNNYEVKKTSFNQHGEVIFWEEYQYNANGVKIKIDNYSGPGSYRGEGTYIEDDSFETWYELDYDPDGNNVKTTQYYKDGTMIGWIEHQYDADGNKVKSTPYNANGSLTGTFTEYKFDTDRNQLKHLYLNADGELTGSEAFEYQYDTSGALIKEIVYGSDGDMLRWSEYQYDTWH